MALSIILKIMPRLWESSLKEQDTSLTCLCHLRYWKSFKWSYTYSKHRQPFTAPPPMQSFQVTLFPADTGIREKTWNNWQRTLWVYADENIKRRAFTLSADAQWITSCYVTELCVCTRVCLSCDGPPRQTARQCNKSHVLDFRLYFSQSKIDSIQSDRTGNIWTGNCDWFTFSFFLFSVVGRHTLNLEPRVKRLRIIHYQIVCSNS